MFFPLHLWMVMTLCYGTNAESVIKHSNKYSLRDHNDLNVLHRRLMNDDYSLWRDENYDDIWPDRRRKHGYIEAADGDDAEDEGEPEVEETDEQPEELPEDETVNEETEATPLEYVDYDANKSEKPEKDDYEDVDISSAEASIITTINLILSCLLHSFMT